MHPCDSTVFSVLEQCIMECCLQFVSALHLSIHCILAAEPVLMELFGLDPNKPDRVSYSE